MMHWILTDDFESTSVSIAILYQNYCKFVEPIEWSIFTDPAIIGKKQIENRRSERVAIGQCIW